MDFNVNISISDIWFSRFYSSFSLAVIHFLTLLSCCVYRNGRVLTVFAVFPFSLAATILLLFFLLLFFFVFVFRLNCVSFVSLTWLWFNQLTVFICWFILVCYLNTYYCWVHCTWLILSHVPNIWLVFGSKGQKYMKLLQSGQKYQILFHGPLKYREWEKHWLQTQKCVCHELCQLFLISPRKIREFLDFFVVIIVVCHKNLKGLFWNLEVLWAKYGRKWLKTN